MYSEQNNLTKYMRSKNKNEINATKIEKTKNKIDTITNILYVEEKIEKILTTEANKIVRE